jgi:hypothetical protein
MDRIIQLLNKHLNATISPEEEQELLYYIKTGEYDEIIRERIQEEWQKNAGFTACPDDQIPVILHKILQSEQESARVLNNATAKSYTLYYRSGVVILLILVICLRSWFVQREASAPGKSDARLAPAGEAADGALNGVPPPVPHTRQSNQSMVINRVTAWNTVTTFIGNHYTLTLPDGSQVWLNAGSTLKYPPQFGPSGNRQVILAGEAYFETVTDPNRPFKVSIASNHLQEAAVKALGTRFHIIAYPGKTNIRAVLFEGAVIVSLPGTEKKLLPGQQAIFPQTVDGKIYIDNIDTAVAIAWKKGFFSFDQCASPMIIPQYSNGTMLMSPMK